MNEAFENKECALVDGYAPFCKHLFVPNFANVECGYVALTDENRNLVRCCYEARNEGED